MNILIVSATSFEIKHLIALLRHKTCPDLSGKIYHKQLNKYSYNSHTIDVLITGIGMVQTAFCLGKIFSTNKYNVALNFGIAGSFDKSLQLGDVVHILSDCFSELGAENGENFIKIQDLHILGNDKEKAHPYPFPKGREIKGKNTTERLSAKGGFSYFPTLCQEHRTFKVLPLGEDLGWAVNNNFTNNLPINNPVINKLRKVKAITVNTIHGNKSSIKKVKELYAPNVESMEGAAFLYACLTEKIPNAQIRAISNYIHHIGRDKNKWQTKLAIENLNKIAIEILNLL